MKKKALVIFIAIITFVAVSYFVNATHAKTKYIPKKEVYKTMAKWNKALGMKCSSCHVSPKKKTIHDLKEGDTVNAKELDALANQEAALSMQAMMDHLNKNGGSYTCGSCHQGSVEVD